MNVSFENQGLIIKDGYGPSDCNIDSNSKIRVGEVKKHYKTDLQLFPRPFLTTPLVKKGELKPDLESKLLSSHQTFGNKQMNTINSDRYFTPLTENLKNDVQNPNNIIQSNNNRFGESTNNTIKNNFYFQNSSDSSVVQNLLRNKLNQN